MYHLIGIEDINMSALAQVIKTLGYKVDGSDDQSNLEIEKYLKERNIKFCRFDSNNIHNDMIIIVGDDIPESNTELIKANELNLKIYTCNQMKKRFSEMFDTIAVTGCTGKGLTAEMLTYVFAEIIGCNYMLEDGRGFASKENKYLCMLADENKRKFLDLTPYYTLITNIDFNYPEYYSAIDELISSYQEFINKTEKMNLINGDDQYTRLLNSNQPIFYYGLNNDNDIIAKKVEYSKDGICFEVHVEDNYYGSFELPIYGKHMLLSTLAVIGLCYYERIEAKDVVKALKMFFQNKQFYTEKKYNDLIFIDCILSHHRDLKNTIRSLEQKYPDKSIISVVNTLDILNSNFTSAYIESLNLSSQVYTDTSLDSDIIIDSKYHVLDDLSKLMTLKNSVLLFIGLDHSNFLLEKFEDIIDHKKNNR